MTKVLIISPMKDEAPYLLEWLAYYRAIGVTDFLIYSNDCSDGTDLLLDRLQFNGIVRHERNEVLRRGPQKSAFKYALGHEAYTSSDWVFVCDIDEFLNIKTGGGQISDLIDYYPKAVAIPVAWKMFSHNGLTDLYPGLTTEALVDAESHEAKPGDEGRFVKTLFRRSTDVERIGVHGPIYRADAEDANKWESAWLESDPDSDPKRPLRNFGYEVAQVNHYAVRTVDAFLLKRHRGRVNHTKQTMGLDYWQRWCRGGHVDHSIRRFSASLQRELQQLRKDPIVRSLHDGGIAYHRDRLEQLLEDEEYRALRSELIAAPGHGARRSSPPKDSEPVRPGAAATEALIAKAPKRHQNRLRLLEKMPKNGRCAEIGVWNGAFSNAILEVTVPAELTLIDPWDLLSDQGEEEWTHNKHQNHSEMRLMYDGVLSRYASNENVTVQRGFSYEVLPTFPDAYFDWIYIDGNHLYEFVRKDLSLGFRKVKPGGIIAGDDFFWKQDGRMHVREAVLDEMQSQGLTNRPTRLGQQYMIRVPG